MSFSEGDGQILVYCHVCSPGDVAGYFQRFLDRLNGKDVIAPAPARLAQARTRRTNRRSDVWRPSGIIYYYPDEQGRPLARKLHGTVTDGESGEERRSFRWEHAVPAPHGDGVIWLPRLDGIEAPLHDLPTLRSGIAAGLEVWVCEGESDAMAARAVVDRKPIVVTSVPHGAALPGQASKWLEAYTEALKGAKRVHIYADKDDAGLAHAEAARASLTAAGIDVTVWRPPYLKDVRAHLESGRPMDEMVKVDPPEPPTTPTRRTHWTAAELMAEPDEPIRWAVPYLVPEGLTMLAGSPKAGKSLVALRIALDVARGQPVFGTLALSEPATVLVLSLEDGHRRARRRLRQMLGDEPAPQGLHLHTEWLKLGAGGLDALETHIRAHQPTLVVVDILQRVRSEPKAGQAVYAADYEALIGLKALADRTRTPIVVVHHSRKADSSDWLDLVSGSHGLAGACDTVIVLKRPREKEAVTLHITGRDVEEASYVLDCDKETWTYTFNSETEDPATVGLGEVARKILATLRDHPGSMRPKAIEVVTGLDGSKIRHRLRTLVDRGLVSYDGAGNYVGVTAVTASQKLSDLQKHYGLTVTATVTAPSGPSPPAVTDSPMDSHLPTDCPMGQAESTEDGSRDDCDGAVTVPPSRLRRSERFSDAVTPVTVIRTTTVTATGRACAMAGCDSTDNVTDWKIAGPRCQVHTPHHAIYRHR